MGFVGILMAIVQGGLIRVVVPWLGARRAGLMGLGFAIVAFFGYAFASQGWQAYAWTVSMALAGFVYPALNGLMSSAVAADAQGELQGAVASAAGLAEIVGPLLMTQLFARFTADNATWYFPGAPFFVAALLTFVATTLAASVFARARRPDDRMPVT